MGTLRVGKSSAPHTLRCALSSPTALMSPGMLSHHLAKWPAGVTNKWAVRGPTTFLVRNNHHHHHHRYRPGQEMSSAKMRDQASALVVPMKRRNRVVAPFPLQWLPVVPDSFDVPGYVEPPPREVASGSDEQVGGAGANDIPGSKQPPPPPPPLPLPPGPGNFISEDARPSISTGGAHEETESSGGTLPSPVASAPIPPASDTVQRETNGNDAFPPPALQPPTPLLGGGGGDRADPHGEVEGTVLSGLNSSPSLAPAPAKAESHRPESGNGIVRDETGSGPGGHASSAAPAPPSRANGAEQQDAGDNEAETNQDDDGSVASAAARLGALAVLAVAVAVGGPL
ncbi:hypothetical protein DQ04_00051130 [Trypanosoma grayi]|uniref:hypothetical protein n=1 Tax=Trypanosoma grayi TaxID=71804 RepID=UPI0004F47EA3|nr:hypothetical protein DQ04_00051130 [Trypanosoma grayi]KEG15518.1 hypothetical protein DQ04_00051130 [Trypanosoma grayi]